MAFYDILFITFYELLWQFFYNILFYFSYLFYLKVLHNCIVL